MTSWDNSNICGSMLSSAGSVNMFSVAPTLLYTLALLLVFSSRMNHIISLILFYVPFHKCDLKNSKKKKKKIWPKHFQDSGAGKIKVLKYITCDSNMWPEWQCLHSSPSTRSTPCPVGFQGCHPIQCQAVETVCSRPADLRRSIFLSFF